MGRIARVVAPGYPHHVVQRGNRRQETFFCEGDYQAYGKLLSEWCTRCGIEVWCYCFMPNHVHMILVPGSEGGLHKAVGEVHRRYTRMVNFREGWRGHLWQGRFSSFVMDEKHLLAAARYIEMNPVRAGLVGLPWEYRWSSAKAHVSGQDDGLVGRSLLTEMVGDWRSFLAAGGDGGKDKEIRRHERTGRPLGDEVFLERLEHLLERALKKKKPGPKTKQSSGN